MVGLARIFPYAFVPDNIPVFRGPGYPPGTHSVVRLDCDDIESTSGEHHC
jgi:hypothetical protein